MNLTISCPFQGVCVLCFVVNSILRFALLPYYGRYNLFIRNQVDYADVIYGQTYNSFFHEKIESIQCKFDNNRCDKKGTLFEKLYQELRLGSLKSRRQFIKASHFCKTFKQKCSSYLFSLICNLNRVDNARYNINVIHAINVSQYYFKNSFFHPVISEWKKL